MIIMIIATVKREKNVVDGLNWTTFRFGEHSPFSFLLLFFSFVFFFFLFNQPMNE